MPALGLAGQSHEQAEQEGADNDPARQAG